jgi:hypothetical protein
MDARTLGHRIGRVLRSWIGDTRRRHGLESIWTGLRLSGRVIRSQQGSFTVSENMKEMLPSLTLFLVEGVTKSAAEGSKTAVKGLTVDIVTQSSERYLKGQAGVIVLFHDIEGLFERDPKRNG